MDLQRKSKLLRTAKSKIVCVCVCVCVCVGGWRMKF